MKKTILLLVYLLFAGYLSAEETFKVDNYTYKVLTDNTVAVNSYEYGGLTDITVPSSVTYGNTKYRVVAIASYGFSGIGRLTSITLPASIITIETGAFNSCVGLMAFDIPEAVQNIVGDAFSGCTNLAEFTVSSDNESYKSVDGVIFNKDGGKLIAFPCGKGGNYIFPEGVSEIGNSAFAGNKVLTQVEFPESLLTIGESAFYGCEGLASVTLPTAVSILGKSAFKGCKGLLTVSISKSVSTIGEGLFVNCSNLQSILVDTENANYSSIDGVLFDKQQTTLLMYPLGKGDIYEIPSSTVIIGNKAFQNANISAITFPESLVEIGSYAFGDCSNLTELTLPVNLEVIGDDAFEYCMGLRKVTIASAKTLGKYAFLSCEALKTLSLPESLEEIKDYAFWGCKKLDDFVIPDKVNGIGEAAFYKCRALTEITLGASVKTIGSLAFGSCDDLITVNSRNPIPPALATDAFEQGESYLTLHVPEGKYDDYKSADVWKNFKEIVADLSKPTQIVPVPASYPIKVDNSKEGCLEVISDKSQILMIYDMNGKLMAATVLQEGGNRFMLNSGFYVAKIGSRSQKVVVR